MSELPMRGHFRYLSFKTFPMTPRTPQCEVFCPLLSSSEHSGVPEDSKSPTFPSVGLHPHTWPKWGCDTSRPSKMNAWTLGFEGEYDFSKYLVLWSAWLSRYKCFIYVVDRFWGSICIFTPCGNIKNSNAPMCYEKRWIKVQYMVLKINGGLIIVVEEKLANN